MYIRKYLPLAALVLLGSCNQTPKTSEKPAATDSTATMANPTPADSAKPAETATEEAASTEEKIEKFATLENDENESIPFEFAFKKADNQVKATCKDTATFASLVKGQYVYDGIWSTCDVNADGKTDYLIRVKGTSKEALTTNDEGEKVDRNRRGFILAINKGDHFETDVRNLNCFPSENEDGGVYYAPELSVEAEGRTLNVNYSHGRYGSWGYTFNHTNGNYELTKCERTENHGPVTETEYALDLTSNTMKRSKLKGEFYDYGEDGPNASDYEKNTYKVKQLRKVLITEIANIF